MLMTRISVAHAAVGGEGLARGQEGDQLSRWEMLGALQREQVRFCSVWKVGQTGLVDGAQVGREERRIKDVA